MFKQDKFVQSSKIVVLTLLILPLSGCYLKFGTNKRPVVAAPTVVVTQPTANPSAEQPAVPQTEHSLQPTSR